MGSQYEELSGWKKLNSILENTYEVQFYNDRQPGFTNACGMLWGHGMLGSTALGAESAASGYCFRWSFTPSSKNNG